jgi:DNA helicase-2/ATP-dependent DNA helicase PcrA
MISLQQFKALVLATRPKLNSPDDEQSKAVFAPSDADLFIVAGPGTGKTACLTYRTLYLIFVAGLNPGQIVATTFTRKAAAELSSRILGWGYRMIDATGAASLPPLAAEWMKAIDLNQIITGTLDGLCETVMREHRAAGEEPPVLADEYVTRTVMLRDGLRIRQTRGQCGGASARWSKAKSVAAA